MLSLFLLACAPKAPPTPAVEAPPPEVAPAEAAPTPQGAVTRVEVPAPTRPHERICVTMDPPLYALHRKGVEDPYEVLNPPYGMVQLETFTFGAFMQLIVFRGDPPKPGVVEPRVGLKRGADLAEAAGPVSVDGEVLRLSCLGHATQSSDLLAACQAARLRWCDPGEE